MWTIVGHMGGLSEDMNKGCMLASTRAVKRWKGKRFETDLSRAKTEVGNRNSERQDLSRDCVDECPHGFFSFFNCAKCNPSQAVVNTPME